MIKATRENILKAKDRMDKGELVSISEREGFLFIVEKVKKAAVKKIAEAKIKKPSKKSKKKEDK